MAPVVVEEEQARARSQARSFASWSQVLLGPSCPDPPPTETNLVSLIAEGTFLAAVASAAATDDERTGPTNLFASAKSAAVQGRIGCIERISGALSTLRDSGLEPVNVRPGPLCDKDERMALGLMWQIIVWSQKRKGGADGGARDADAVAGGGGPADAAGDTARGSGPGGDLGAMERASPDPSDPSDAGGEGKGGKGGSAAGVRDPLLSWVNNELAIAHRDSLGALPLIVVSDFTASFSDGIALSILAGHFGYRFTPTAEAPIGSAVHLDHLFAFIETEMGIPSVLEAQSVFETRRTPKQECYAYVAAMRLAVERFLAYRASVAAADESKEEGAETDGVNAGDVSDGHEEARLREAIAAEEDKSAQARGRIGAQQRENDLLREQLSALDDISARLAAGEAIDSDLDALAALEQAVSERLANLRVGTGDDRSTDGAGPPREGEEPSDSDDEPRCPCGNEAEIVLAPCAHLAACTKCVRRLFKCPKCKVAVSR